MWANTVPIKEHPEAFEFSVCAFDRKMQPPLQRLREQSESQPRYCKVPALVLPSNNQNSAADEIVFHKKKMRKDHRKTREENIFSILRYFPNNTKGKILLR